MEGKSFWQSKTMWFNLLSGIVAAAGVYAAPTSGISANYAQIFAGVVTVGNIFLRAISKDAITK